MRISHYPSNVVAKERLELTCHFGGKSHLLMVLQGISTGKSLHICPSPGKTGHTASISVKVLSYPLIGDFGAARPQFWAHNAEKCPAFQGN
jgi:hypothetical protein